MHTYYYLHLLYFYFSNFLYLGLPCWSPLSKLLISSITIFTRNKLWVTSTRNFVFKFKVMHFKSKFILQRAKNSFNMPPRKRKRANIYRKVVNLKDVCLSFKINHSWIGLEEYSKISQRNFRASQSKKRFRTISWIIKFNLNLLNSVKWSRSCKVHVDVMRNYTIALWDIIL